MLAASHVFAMEKEMLNHQLVLSTVQCYGIFASNIPEQLQSINSLLNKLVLGIMNLNVAVK